jgi:hypothetical protein
MYRNELKYLINDLHKNTLAKKLNALCQRDAFSDSNGGYQVSSLYFDDYNQNALVDKLIGIGERKKFRIRVYNSRSDVIKLERKIKKNTVTQKNQLPISKEEYALLVNGDAGFLKHKDDPVAKDFYLNFQTMNLRPKVVVEYRREAYVYKYGDVRITFDQFLKAGIFQNDLFSRGYMIPALPQRQIILEVKYTGYLPGVIRNLIQVNSLQWQALSKYALCCLVGM